MNISHVTYIVKDQWGTGKAYYHIEDGEAFETIEALNAHYNIELLNQQTNG